MLVSENQILGPDNMNTEFTNKQSTDSQAGTIRENKDAASSNYSKETSVTEEHPSWATRTSGRQRKRSYKQRESLGYNLPKRRTYIY